MTTDSMLPGTSHLPSRWRGYALLAGAVAGLWLSGAGQSASAALLYSASLHNGDYGGGFIVDTFSSCTDADGSSCGDGNLSNIGIVDTAQGVDFTASNAVINYSIGRDYGSSVQSSFRAQGTVAVWLRADVNAFRTGQPFTDNYGFNQFNSGQGTFGVGFGRIAGPDTVINTGDDRLSVSWGTWHNNVWYYHTVASPVQLELGRWNNIGFAWGGAGNDFEVWVNGVLAAPDNLPYGVAQSWGSSGVGLGSAYNFALGEIHERSVGNSSTYGISFADLEIWNEYRPLGATVVPLPATVWLLLPALAGVGAFARRSRT